MSKPSPFDYVKSICEKKQMDDLTGYSPFLINRCFAMHLDTVLFAEEMNYYHQISPEMQYNFYYHSVRKAKRFGFPPKPSEQDNLELIMEYYGYSRGKALEALQILTAEQIEIIKKRGQTGGMSK